MRYGLYYVQNNLCIVQYIENGQIYHKIPEEKDCEKKLKRIFGTVFSRTYLLLIWFKVVVAFY